MENKSLELKEIIKKVKNGENTNFSGFDTYLRKIDSNKLYLLFIINDKKEEEIKNLILFLGLLKGVMETGLEATGKTVDFEYYYGDGSILLEVFSEEDFECIPEILQKIGEKYNDELVIEKLIPYLERY